MDERLTAENSGDDASINDAALNDIRFFNIYGGEGKGRHQHKLLLKIGDFGLAVQNGSWNGEDGDKCYLAPEVLRHKVKPDPARVGFPADIFSLGATMLEMLLHRELPKG